MEEIVGLLGRATIRLLALTAPGVSAGSAWVSKRRARPTAAGSRLRKDNRKLGLTLAPRVLAADRLESPSRSGEES